MDQNQENDNFIDKTFSIMTDIFVKTFIDNEQAKTNQLKTIEDFFRYSDNEFADYEPLKRKNK